MGWLKFMTIAPFTGAPDVVGATASRCGAARTLLKEGSSAGGAGTGAVDVPAGACGGAWPTVSDGSAIAVLAPTACTRCPSYAAKAPADSRARIRATTARRRPLPSGHLVIALLMRIS